MSDLLALYQEIILDHGRKPRFFYQPVDYTCEQQGFNPLCGDKVHLYGIIQKGCVQEMGFKGQGCAISMASTSLMLEAIQGRSLTETQEIFKNFHQMMLSDRQFDENYQAILAKLEILKGVKQYPARVKCATLAWHTLELLLKRCGDQHV
jgi:nitrogen fixation NifU-like protein